MEGLGVPIHLMQKDMVQVEDTAAEEVTELLVL